MGDWEQWERTIERVLIVLDNRLEEQCSALIEQCSALIEQCSALIEQWLLIVDNEQCFNVY
jgi:hypothetical protein